MSAIIQRSCLVRLIDSDRRIDKRVLHVPLVNYTRTTDLMVEQIQAIPTTAGGTLLVMGGVTSPGWAAFQNLDLTNYIEIGFQVGGTFYAALQLGPGDEFHGPLSPTPTWRAMANTAAVNLAYTIFQRN